MDIAYGIKVSESEDPYISNAEEALKGLAEAGTPGSFLVDLLPILKYVPSWMPGAGFKRKAAYWRKVNLDMAEKPFEHVKATLVSSIAVSSYPPLISEYKQRQGNAVPSVAATMIEALPGESGVRRVEEEKLAQGVTSVTYAGEPFVRCQFMISKALSIKKLTKAGSDTVSQFHLPF
jgi:hypothetical protein